MKKGKKLCKKVLSGRAKMTSLDRYEVGDTVFHLYGTPHTFRVSTASDTHAQCAVCGDFLSQNVDF